VKRSPLFTIALALALAIVVVWWQLAEMRARKETARADRVTARVGVLWDSLRIVRKVRPTAPAPPVRAISDEWLAELRRRGLSDPLRQIPASLAQHSELIPIQGVEGGTMGFYDDAGVVLLDGPWVQASYDDGHIGGTGIFEYSVGPGGRLTWKRLAARME
jgi:hypothetical protein